MWKILGWIALGIAIGFAIDDAALHVAGTSFTQLAAQMKGS